MELDQSDGADIFYFTSFTSRDVWTQLRGGVPLYHEDDILALSMGQIGEVANGFLLSLAPVSLGAPIKLPTSFKWPPPTSSCLYTNTLI